MPNDVEQRIAAMTSEDAKRCLAALVEAFRGPGDYASYQNAVEVLNEWGLNPVVDDDLEEERRDEKRGLYPQHLDPSN